jgi:hypothetical protein
MMEIRLITVWSEDEKVWKKIRKIDLFLIIL